MFQFLRKCVTKFSRRAKRPNPSRRPEFDRLETRDTPALFAPVTHVNLITAGQQGPGAVAAAGNGNRVAVWINSPVAAVREVRARVFNFNHVPLTGEILVAAGVNIAVNPDVAADNVGNFVVVFTRAVGANTNVHARRFNPVGGALGAEFVVAATAIPETNPSVARTGTGDFVIAYQANPAPANGNIHAKRFSGAGAFQSFHNVAVTAANEATPDVDRNVAGPAQFAIAYSTSVGLRLNRYTAVGGLVGISVVTPVPVTRDPEVAMDFAGTSVVTWEQSGNILARKVSFAGVLGPFLSIAATADLESDPNVAVDRSDGDFVISYTRRVSATTFQNIVTERSAGGAIKGTFLLSTVVGPSTGTAIAMDPLDRYSAGWVSFNFGGDPSFGVWARRGVLV